VESENILLTVCGLTVGLDEVVLDGNTGTFFLKAIENGLPKNAIGPAYVG
jgi:hypothetical protein